MKREERVSAVETYRANTTREQRRADHDAEHAAEWAIKDFARTAKKSANPFDVETDTTKGWTLEFPTLAGTLGHYKAVYFRGIKGHPELVRISSSNYRCEDEANGVYTNSDGRGFWRNLIKAGFLPK